MKASFTFFTIVLVCSVIGAKCQSEPIHDEWVKKDSIFIDSLSKAYKTNPLNMENFRLKVIKQGESVFKAEESEKLGFEYNFISGYYNSGFRYGGYCYSEIFYKLVYYQKKLVGFRLEPKMPKDQRLTARYLKIFAKLFAVNNNLTPDPLNYNYDELCKPLPDHEGSFPVLNDEIKFFMTPFVGIEYVMYGGDPMHLLSIRRYFEKIKEHFNPEICELLMYSKNAATRLFAIEYYYKNQKLFIKNRERIESRINVIFKELPEIRTEYSDVYGYGNAKELVKKFSKVEP
jgi:hypothetical protein